MNLWTPTFSDDHNYAFVFTETGFDATQPISSVRDLAVSMWEHACGPAAWNGRFANQPLSAINSAFIDKNVFNILNTGVFLAFFILLFNFLFPKLENKTNLNLLFLFSVIWFLLPGFSKALLWMCGSFNYLWAITFVLGFLAILFHFRERQINLLGLIGIFLFGQLAGWMHEGCSLGISFGLLLNMFIRWKNKELTKFEIVATLGFWLGTCFVLFAPGIIMRGLGALGAERSSPFSISALALNFIRTCWFAKATTLLLIIIGTMSFFKREKLILVLKENIIFSGAIFVLLPFFILFGGSVSENASLGLSIFSTILLFRIFDNTKFVKYTEVISLPFSLLAIISALFFILPEAKENSKNHKELFSKIKRVSSNDSYLVFNDLKGRMDVSERYLNRNMYDSVACPDSFQNKFMFSFYGKSKNLPIIPENVANYIENNIVPEGTKILNDNWIDCPNSWFFVKKLNKNESEPKQAGIHFEIDYSRSSFEQKNLLIPLLKKAGRLPTGFSKQKNGEMTIVQNKKGEKFILLLHLKTIESSLRTPIKINKIEIIE